MACGFTHSIRVTVSFNLTTWLRSNSAAKEWCATSGSAAANTPIPAAANQSLVFIGFLSSAIGLRLFYSKREARHQHAIPGRDIHHGRESGAADLSRRVDRPEARVRVYISVREERSRLGDIRVARIVKVCPVEHVVQFQPDI